MHSTGSGGASAPPFLPIYDGPVLVCGNAYCLRDDHARAREHYPDVPVIAVNGAAGEVQAEFLFTQHPRKFQRWIAWQRERFGEGFTTHSAGKAHLASKFGVRERMPWVDYWWEGVASGGTSTWGARRLARLLGFDEVILCGMPLSRGGYANGRMARDFQRDEVIDHYRQMVLRDTDWHEGVRSMSGWTREIFGGI